jgi:hypothetical protein
MKWMTMAALLFVTACGTDGVTEPVSVFDIQESRETVTCTNGVTRPAAVITRDTRNTNATVLVHFCNGSERVGIVGQDTVRVFESRLDMTVFRFTSGNPVWSMETAVDISRCMTAHQGSPLCYSIHL